MSLELQMAQEYAKRSIVRLRVRPLEIVVHEAWFQSVFVVGLQLVAVLPLVHEPAVVLCLPAPTSWRSNHVYGGVRMYVYARRMTTSNLRI